MREETQTVAQTVCLSDDYLHHHHANTMHSIVASPLAPPPSSLRPTVTSPSLIPPPLTVEKEGRKGT